MRPEFMIERHGRKYVLVAGLVDAAHTAGIQSIEQEILQFPSEANGHTTICRATVTDKDGRRFQGIGDANKENVGKNIQPHSIRMAATRSVARALRDFLNIGAASLEELGGGNPEDSIVAPQTTRRPPDTQNPVSGSQETNAAPERTKGGASRKAADYLEKLVSKKYSGDFGRFRDEVGKTLEAMNGREVSEWIDKLSEGRA